MIVPLKFTMQASVSSHWARVTEDIGGGQYRWNRVEPDEFGKWIDLSETGTAREANDSVPRLGRIAWVSQMKFKDGPTVGYFFVGDSVV